jgi:hypothetical protein
LLRIRLHSFFFYLWCFQSNDMGNEFEKLMQFNIFFFSYFLLWFYHFYIIKKKDWCYCYLKFLFYQFILGLWSRLRVFRPFLNIFKKTKTVMFVFNFWRIFLFYIDEFYFIKNIYFEIIFLICLILHKFFLFYINRNLIKKNEKK